MKGKMDIFVFAFHFFLCFSLFFRNIIHLRLLWESQLQQKQHSSPPQLRFASHFRFLCFCFRWLRSIKWLSCATERILVIYDDINQRFICSLHSSSPSILTWVITCEVLAINSWNIFKKYFSNIKLDQRSSVQAPTKP